MDPPVAEEEIAMKFFGLYIKLLFILLLLLVLVPVNSLFYLRDQCVFAFLLVIVNVRFLTVEFPISQIVNLFYFIVRIFSILDCN